MESRVVHRIEVAQPCFAAVNIKAFDFVEGLYFLAAKKGRKIIMRKESDRIGIISILQKPECRDELLRYTQINWPGVAAYFEKQLDESLCPAGELPKTYMLMKSGSIIGFCQLLRQEIVKRQDLSPWISTVFVDERQRGHGYGSLMLLHGRKEAGKLGYNKVYLATGEIGYYEKYGFREIGLDTFPSGKPTKLYENDTIVE